VRNHAFHWRNSRPLIVWIKLEAQKGLPAFMHLSNNGEINRNCWEL
jgi:hypothetical protein